MEGGEELPACRVSVHVMQASDVSPNMSSSIMVFDGNERMNVDLQLMIVLS